MSPSRPTSYHSDWSDLAFGHKKAVNHLSATFIAAPREISAARFTQLVKQYLPQGNMVIGLAKEDYVLGFEGQPQFKTLAQTTIQTIIDKTNVASPKHKIYTLSYAQRDTKYLFENLDFRRVVLINGSWKHTFHTQAPFLELVRRHTPYELLSPFTDEAEAKAYEKTTWPVIEASLKTIRPKVAYVEADILAQASDIAKCSYDYSFQTGVVLGRQIALGYQVLARTFNRVVPFQTYAMHYGASRETHFSPPHDLNHYDTVHAEVELIITAQKERLSLTGTTLFINLLPCPSCARMLCETDIVEFVYRNDHSDGYAIQLLEKAGKIVRRIVA